MIEKICVDPDISRTRSRHTWEIQVTGSNGPPVTGTDQDRFLP